MNQSSNKEQGKKKIIPIKTFPVPFALVEKKENITITTNTPNKPSKKQIINQAFKFHSQGNISEAAKCYKRFIDQGFAGYKVFFNYGIILRDLCKIKEAELSTRKAIEIKPDFAEAYSNLGIILMRLGKLQESEKSTRKAIEIKPDFADAYWNLYGLSNSIEEAEERINQCLKIDENYLEAILIKSALKLHQGDQSLFDNLIKSSYKNHPTTVLLNGFLLYQNYLNCFFIDGHYLTV